MCMHWRQIKISRVDIILIIPTCHLMLSVIFLLNVVIFVCPICVCMSKQNMLKLELIFLGEGCNFVIIFFILQIFVFLN